ncbi:IPTL-CTERM sorting domain-containing protein [Brevundimonas diminuta]
MPPPPAPAPIPTLSEWAMILLGVALAGAAALTIHRRRTA